MADNYLENKMEELRRGHKAKAQLSLYRKMKKGRVWVAEYRTVGAEELRRLCREGYEVWFGGGENPIEASRLARTLGCRYVPAGMAPPPDCQRLTFDDMSTKSSTVMS